MKVEIIVNSFIDENTYIIYENDTCIIVDPGSDFSRMVAFIEEKELKNINIYLTHSHFDHVLSVNDLVERYNCPVYTHEFELEALEKPNINMSSSFSKEIVIKGAIGIKDSLPISHFENVIYHVPGHTYGHSMLEIKKLNALFAGDFVFYHEIGRCDLPTGSLQDMYNSLDFLATLNPKLIIYPGHGQITNVAEEIKYNPYMNR